MEYVRINLMLFQQNLNTAGVQGLLLLSLQNGNHHPALDVGSQENGKIHPLEMGSQISTYLVRQRKLAAESVHLT